MVIEKEINMAQLYSDLTPSQILADPLINTVMRADHVSRRELELLMKSVARNLNADAGKQWRRPVPAFIAARPLKDIGNVSAGVQIDACGGAAC
jgi:hypothetical protein